MIYARYRDAACGVAIQATRLAAMCSLVTSLLVSDAFAQGTTPDVGIRFQPPNAVLLTNAKIVVSPDKTLDSADMLVRDGKIVEVWLFSSDPEQEDTFWGK